MVFEYKNLDKAERDAVRSRMNAPDPEPAYEDFLTGWEEAHVAHRALRDAAVADGDEDEVSRNEEAIAALEKSIENVRLGKRPDGTNRPTPPAPPAPAPVEPSPQPAAPTDPAPAPADPAPAPVEPAPRKATAKKAAE